MILYNTNISPNYPSSGIIRDNVLKIQSHGHHMLRSPDWVNGLKLGIEIFKENSKKKMELGLTNSSLVFCHKIVVKKSKKCSSIRKISSYVYLTKHFRSLVNPLQEIVEWQNSNLYWAMKAGFTQSLGEHCLFWLVLGWAI